MRKDYVGIVVCCIFCISIMYSTSLIIASCRALYYRSLHAYIIRNKYRLCAQWLRLHQSMAKKLDEKTISFKTYDTVEAMTTTYTHEQGASAHEQNFDPPSAHSIVPSYSHTNSLGKTPRSFFAWPLKIGSFWISSWFGKRKKKDGSIGFHTGIDLAALKGTPVYAARSGRVVQAYNAHGYGKTIVLHHGKFKTRYAHLDTIHVTRGDWVHKHTMIGRVGDTGFIRKKGKDGSHLHFEVYEYEKQVNPMQFLPKLV